MTPNEKDRIECAIRHIQTATDIDPWAQELAVDALQTRMKLLDILSGFGSDLPCDEAPDPEWCAEHCEYLEPQHECWLRYVRGLANDDKDKFEELEREGDEP